MRKTLDNELRCLPIVEVEINLSNGDTIQTKTAAVAKETDMDYYLLRNKMQQLTVRQKLNSHSINTVITRQKAHQVGADQLTKTEPSHWDVRRTRPPPPAAATEEKIPSR